MEDIVVLISLTLVSLNSLCSKDNVSFKVPKRLLLEYTGLFRNLYASNNLVQIRALDKTDGAEDEKKGNPEVFHISEINSDILTLVIDYLKLKDLWVSADFVIVENGERLSFRNFPLNLRRSWISWEQPCFLNVSVIMGLCLFVFFTHSFSYFGNSCNMENRKRITGCDV